MSPDTPRDAAPPIEVCRSSRTRPSRFDLSAAFLAMVLFSPVILGLYLPGPEDLPRYHLPCAALWRNAVLSGRLPVANPLNGMGEEFMGVPSTQALYPPKIVFLLAPPITAMGLYLAFHWALLAIGARRFLEGMGCRGSAATTVAILVSLSAPVLSRAGLVHEFSSMAWLFWVMAPPRGKVTRHAPMILLFLAGSPEIIAIGLFSVMAATLSRRTGGKESAFAPGSAHGDADEGGGHHGCPMESEVPLPHLCFAGIAASVSAAILISLPVWARFAAWLPVSVRMGGLHPSEAALGSTSLGLLPVHLLNPASNGAGWMPWEGGGLGIPPLLLAAALSAILASFSRGRGPMTRPAMAWLGVASGIFACLSVSSISGAIPRGLGFLRELPVLGSAFSMLRYTGKSYVALLPPLALLAGLGLSNFVREKPDTGEGVSLGAGVTFGLGAGAASILLDPASFSSALCSWAFVAAVVTTAAVAAARGRKSAGTLLAAISLLAWCFGVGSLHFSNMAEAPRVEAAWPNPESPSPGHDTDFGTRRMAARIRPSSTPVREAAPGSAESLEPMVNVFSNRASAFSFGPVASGFAAENVIESAAGRPRRPDGISAFAHLALTVTMGEKGHHAVLRLEDPSGGGNKGRKIDIKDANAFLPLGIAWVPGLGVAAESPFRVMKSGCEAVLAFREEEDKTVAVPLTLILEVGVLPW